MKEEEDGGETDEGLQDIKSELSLLLEPSATSYARGGGLGRESAVRGRLGREQ